MAMELTGLEGKVAVVTGAGRMRGIGRAIAVSLARAGCDVAVTGTGRDPASYPEAEQAAGWRDIKSVAEEIEALGRRALPLILDVTNAFQIDLVASNTVNTLGRVDFVVNNAGATRGLDQNPVVDVPPNAWRRVMDVNLNGAFYVSRAFGRRLVAQGEGGAIINISSIASKVFGPNEAAYSASKAGQNALTACMAREMGQYKVRVNAVCPGLVDAARMESTPRAKDAARQEGVGAKADAGFDWDAHVETNIPLGRAGETADIANAVVYLCSDQGAWITGQSINVDGGDCVWR
ncbi:MAG: SDR family NAD(P)-dependent oxidoreductase [Chloroflexota bacterium]|nr:SDR family NAD(P)-dependent oxidoreductase [Chloroflexota bacterium]